MFEVFAADDKTDAFFKIVCDDGELVSPLPDAIFEGKVSTEFFGVFDELAEEQIFPFHVCVRCFETDRMIFGEGKSQVLAVPLVNDFSVGIRRIRFEGEFSGAVAGVNEIFGTELFEQAFVAFRVRTLDGFRFPGEAYPFEIFADRVDVSLPCAALVVVFDAQADAVAVFFGGGVDTEGGKDVPAVQVSCGAWRKSCERIFGIHRIIS